MPQLWLSLLFLFGSLLGSNIVPFQAFMIPSLPAIRSTAAELLAFVICKMFPDAKLISGGINEFGFYYDFIVDFPFDSYFITTIEEAMRGLAKEGHQITTREMMRENAADFFEHRHQPLKAELIRSSPYNIIPLIAFDGFFDVAPSLFTDFTSDVVAFKIYDLEIFDHYLPELGEFSAIRITGNAFEDKQKLKQFTKLLKLEKEHDHRSLIQSMELFSHDEEVSPLSGFLLPKGCVLRDLLWKLREETVKNKNILSVITPQFLTESFIKKSGCSLGKGIHAVIDENEYMAGQSPEMAHAFLFAMRTRFESDLPLRYSENKEISLGFGPKTHLFGLLKTLSYWQDYIISFCTAEQIYDELISSLQFIDKIVTIMSFRYQWRLFSKKEKAAGTQKQWDQTLLLMRKALDDCGFSYIEEMHEASFAGPKIEALIFDIAGRSWSGPELAVDFHIPTRLELQFRGKEGPLMKPFMVKCSVFGPLERWIALLVEKYAGALPLWLAPEQVRIVSVNSLQDSYCKELLLELQKMEIRATCDLRPSEVIALGAKIHEAECAKVPYLLIIGESEQHKKIVNVRKCGQKAVSERMSLEAFIQEVQGQGIYDNECAE